MDVLANSVFAVLTSKDGSFRTVDPARLMMFMRDRDIYPPYEQGKGITSFFETCSQQGWVPCGACKMIDTNTGLMARIRYHGPSLEEVGHIRLAGRLAWAACERDRKGLMLPDVELPVEMGIYQLDPENQRIYLMGEKNQDGELVWPIEGEDYTSKLIPLTELKKEEKE